MKVIKESLKEATSASDKVRMHNKVYKKVFDKLNQDFDNYAIVLASELPGYDPSWCAEAFTKTEIARGTMQDSFAIAVTDMLLANME